MSTTTTSANWNRYEVVNEGLFSEILSGDEPKWPSDEEFRAAGFDPEDEELSVTTLAKDWEGHKAGALVIYWYAVEGHPFAIKNSDRVTKYSNEIRFYDNYEDAQHAAYLKTRRLRGFARLNYDCGFCVVHGPDGDFAVMSNGQAQEDGFDSIYIA